VEVTVRLFAMLRERAGASEVTVELPEGACVRDALAALGGLADGLPLVMAVNREYAPEDAPLDPGDELALIPPVSGGEAAVVHARVTAEALSLDGLVARVRDPRAGAVVTFQGVTREVDRLDYEAYAEMAEPAVAAIVEGRGRAALAVRRGGRAPRGRGAAGRAERRGGGLGGAPRRGVRGRARDHRPHQGRGADLEEGGRG
jgi:molybdopterin synthase catalytic subunit